MIVIKLQTRLFVHYCSNYTHCEESTAALLIFSVNAFNLSGSLQFLISLQVLQCAFFHLHYVIDNHGVSCCVVCLVAFIGSFTLCL